MELCSMFCNNLIGKRILKMTDTCICINGYLCCTTKTNILLYVNYISVKKKRWTEVAWGENLTCFES